MLLSLSGCLLSVRIRNNLSIYHYISYSFTVQNKCEGPISDGLYQAYSAAESVRMPVISQKQKQAVEAEKTKVEDSDPGRSYSIQKIYSR